MGPELRPPHGATFADLAALLPVFLSYVLSFFGIYWRHDLVQLVRRRHGAIPNLHLLFWLSMAPPPGWGRTTSPRRPRPSMGCRC